MALFGNKKDKTASSQTGNEARETAAKAEDSRMVASTDVTRALIKPRITEKAAALIDQNVYTFEVRMNANKFEIRDAVKALYNVTPIAVRIVKKNPRHSMSRMRGRDMMDHGMKKAYVYLKKGDRIEFV